MTREIFAESAVPVRGRPRRRIRTAVAIAAGALTLAAGSVAVVGSTSAGATGQQAATASQSAHHVKRDVIANLWEWNWVSIAKECTTVLGPKGYGGVQVAPPQDSLSKTDGPVHPWWEVYQPVDYNLTSRMGNEAQFKSMVATCRKAGVKVYVDAVINHMTGQGNISYGGVSYSKYEYQGLYTSANFHHTPADCPTASGNIDDFNNYLQVTKCELVSLSDLRTETSYVRNRLAAYLNKLLSYGVSGFRVDAGKHIPQADMAAIEKLLHRTVDGTRPYIALEVPPGGPGKLSPWAFIGQDDVLGFDFAAQIHDAFKSYTTPPGGNITDLSVFGERSGLLPSDKTLVFVANHDSERNGSTLSYKDGASYLLATEFMLARGYGTPQVYASFAFTGGDDSPPADANGFITNTDCTTGWVCIDRNKGVANMVGWHNYVGDAKVANWADDGVNLIAFSRGNRGWIALNNSDADKTMTFSTGLPRGTYCDVIHGNLAAGDCTGRTFTVDRHGNARVRVPAKDAVAFTVKDLEHH
ncbi:MAG: alpha-amylase [Pseudonocardiales bacterium]|nr:alpha-amylase [Pseudonocardiales bacterium]